MTIPVMTPLLTRHAVVRKLVQDVIPGEYCPVERKWMVDSPKGRRPLIVDARSLATVTTKTKVNAEADDTANSAGLNLLVTKTDVQLESDDESPISASALSLLTKTEVLNEEDKQDVGAWTPAHVELMTKTHTNQEEDKQDFDERFRIACETEVGPLNTDVCMHDMSLPLAVRICH